MTDTTNFREALAALCHEQWSGWKDYEFSKCEPEAVYGDAGKRDEDDLVIPGEFVRRWRRQMETPYAELSEGEKDSDRKEANKFLALFNPLLDAAKALAIEADMYLNDEGDAGELADAIIRVERLTGMAVDPDEVPQCPPN
jgi:hypothetical protein